MRTLFAASLALLGVAAALAETPSIRKPAPAPKAMPVVPKPDAKAASVPAGYTVEVFTEGLIYPTSIEFDAAGNVYVAEAGNIDGDPVAPARIMKGTRTGPGTVTWTTLAEQLSGPVCDLLYHQGKLYVTHRGKLSVIEGSTLKDVVTDLPAFGDHHTNQMSVGPDGKIYFGQGSVTNSGVVGNDNYLLGWLPLNLDAHDVPGYDIKLKGQAFETPDALAALGSNELKKSMTSGFMPYRKTAGGATSVKGKAKASAAVLCVNPDGTGLECHAWGLRNPFGVLWAPDGKLYASDNGYDERGSRPVANSPDCLWEVKKGAWYGWPDFTGGEPVTDPKFKSSAGPQAEFLLSDHPPAEKPLIKFPPHTSVTKLEADAAGRLGPKGALYLAASGDYTPATAVKQGRVGYWVKRVDPTTGKVEDFFGCKKEARGPAGLEYVTTAGPRRPVDVRIGPDGAMYVVDIGPVHFVTSGQGAYARPYPGTGTVWRVSRTAAAGGSPAQ